MNTKDAGEAVARRKKLRPRKNNLLKNFPDIATQWSDENEYGPEMYGAFSGEKVLWVCSEHHTYLATIKHRTRQGTGCAYCAGKAVLSGYNDLEFLYPEIASEWSSKNGIKASEVRPMSNKPYLWECSNGHVYKAYPYHRVGNGSGCPSCCGRVAISGETDLATLRPDILSLWSPKNTIKSHEVTVASGTKILWVCTKGHEWRSSVSTITNGGRCPYCSGHRVILGETDFKTKQPDRVKFWRDEKKPTEVSEFSHYKATWVCEEGHIFKMRVSKVSGGQWCPECVDLRNPAIVSKLAELLGGRVNVRLTDIRWSNGVRFEVDILLDDLVVEYDGGFWHKYSSDKDTYKTQKLLDAGYKVVRVREPVLDLLDINHENLLQVSFRYNLKKLDILAQNIKDYSVHSVGSTSSSLT